jgi:hypothetical protein
MSQGVSMFFVSDKIGWYEPLVLEQAVKIFGADRVIFIGKEPFRFDGRTLLFRDLGSPDLDAFAAAYEHLSTNPRAFEYACFARWFYIRNACRALGRGVALHFDMDLVVGAGFDAELIAAATRAPLALCLPPYCNESASPHVAAVHLDALERFCAFLLDHYRDPQKRAALAARFRAVTQCGGGGVCDMTLLRLFALEQAAANVLTLAGAAVDYNMNHAAHLGERYRVDAFGCKQVEKRGERFYCTTVDGRRREFAALHFQGFSKILIPATLRRYEAYFKLGLASTLRMLRHLYRNRAKCA